MKLWIHLSLFLFFRLALTDDYFRTAFYGGQTLNLRCSAKHIKDVDVISGIFIKQEIPGVRKAIVATAIALQQNGEAILRDRTLVGRTVVHGKCQFDDKQGSYLNMELLQLTPKDSGKYSCLITYLANDGSIKTYIHTTEIKVISYPWNIL